MNMIDFSRESMGLPESFSFELTPLAVRGSDRTFFRLTWDNDGSAILIHYDPKRIENAYYADISIFLQSIDVTVPKLIRHDRGECLILMEDLGNQDLWAFRDAPWSVRSELYQKTLVILQRLHGVSEKDFPSRRVRLMEGFGPELYRWERDYFREHFVSGICKIKLESPLERELEAELCALAVRLEAMKRSLVHRDLQSQNIMVRDEEPFFIDFQGMRFGSPFYDLGSLLCDPYVAFSDDEIDELLSFYYKLSEQNLDWPAFRNYFWEAAAQRLMQALGAYGFLGLTKGLTAFLNHIPAGLGNLLRAASQVASLPLLTELCQACRERIERDDLLLGAEDSLTDNVLLKKIK
jgi:aminoglycoside/choline kinase family phosphotransferase